MPEVTLVSTPPDEAFHFRQPVSVLQFKDTSLPTAPGAKTQRGWFGVGYSGQVIPNHHWFGNVIFDLDTLTVPDNLPALMDHNRAQRVGFATKHEISHEKGVSFEGKLLNNTFANAVKEDSDDGFPWQMSVHINPGSIEEVQAGTPITVNGQQLTGPLTVFRNSKLVEVSFTATGYDANTSAAAMSRGGAAAAANPKQFNQPGDSSMTEQEIQAKVDAAVAAAVAPLNAQLTAANAAKANAEAEVAKFSKAKREDEIKTMFTASGKEYKADAPEVLALFSMDDAQFSVIKSFAPTKPAAKSMDELDPALFSNQADGSSVPETPTVTGAGSALLKDATNKAAFSLGKRAA